MRAEPAADDYFELLGLSRGESDPARIEAAYKERKRLWDQRRHNPAYQHEWACRQEVLARAFETLRRPEKRRAYLGRLAGGSRAGARAATAAEREFREICEIALEAGLLPMRLRARLAEKARRMGISERTARRLVEEARRRAGAREMEPGGIGDPRVRSETAAWFVQRTLAQGALTEEGERMLANLARELGCPADWLAGEIARARPAGARKGGPWRALFRLVGLLSRAEQQAEVLTPLLDEAEGRK